MLFKIMFSLESYYSTYNWYLQASYFYSLCRLDYFYLDQTIFRNLQTLKLYHWIFTVKIVLIQNEFTFIPHKHILQQEKKQRAFRI